MSLSLEFANKLHETLFLPTIILLVAAAWRGPTAWRHGPAWRLMLVAAAAILALRVIFTMIAVPISKRYFLGLAVIALPFAAAGVEQVAAWLVTAWRRLAGRELAPAIARMAVLAAVFIAFVGKGIKPDSSPKIWLREIPRLVAHEAGGLPPVLVVGDVDDFRPAYFAGGSHVKLCRDGEVILWPGPDGVMAKGRCHGGELAVRGMREHASAWLALPDRQGWEHLASRLGEFSEPVFLVIRQEADAFRAEFSGRGLAFPFRPLREFRERPRRPPIILYQFVPDDEDA